MINWNLSAKLWAYAGACGVGVLALIYIFFTSEYEGYAEEKKQMKQEINIKKSQLLLIQTMTQRQGLLEMKIEEAALEFDRLKEMFPDRDSIPKRLQHLTSASRKADITPISFRPAEKSEKEFYIENQYDIEVSASFHGLGQFFQEIANFKYPTAISKVVITEKKRMELELQNATEQGYAPKTTDVNFQLTTFSSKK